jgi:alpha-glucosidase
MELYSTQLRWSRISLRLVFSLILALLAGLTAISPAASAEYSTKVHLGSDLEISLYSPTMFRVRISRLAGEKFPAKYEIPFAVGRIAAWPKVNFRQHTDGDSDIVETSQLQVRVSHADHSWSVWNAAGTRQIYPSAGPVYGIFRDGYTVFDAASALEQRTDYSRYEHWFFNADTGRYVDTYLAEDLIFDQFFIFGPGYDKLFQQLNDLVGPEPLLRKKSYGFFQTQHLGCKGTQSKLMEVATQLRERHIPADTLIIDYEWGDGCPGGDEDDKYWGQLDWSKDYLSPLSPGAMVAKLHDMHFDVMLIHHNAPDFPHRAESVQRDPLRDWTSRVYDEQLWWKRIKEQLDLGVDGTWQDTRKNDVTDSVIWQGLQNYLGTDKRVLFMGNRNMVEVDPWELQRDDRAPSNSLLASRRYPFRWTGDAHTTWSELRWHIDAITNTFGAMAGISYVTADAYASDWKQQARWNQFLAFSPIVRSHTMKPWDVKLDVESLKRIMAFGDKRTNASVVDAPGPFDPEIEAAARKSGMAIPTAESSIRDNLALRYRLLPYIYSEAYRHYSTGFPIVRPMVLSFPDDLHFRFNRWPYQYMFGDAFLVAPVYADLNTMEIYLPEGTDWVDYWNKKSYKGGQTIVYDTSDVAKLPLFVKQGSVIPMRPSSEWIFILPACPRRSSSTRMTVSRCSIKKVNLLRRRLRPESIRAVKSSSKSAKRMATTGASLNQERTSWISTRFFRRPTG